MIVEMLWFPDRDGFYAVRVNGVVRFTSTFRTLPEAQEELRFKTSEAGKARSDQ